MKHIICIAYLLICTVACSHLQRGFLAAAGSPIPESELNAELGQNVFERHCVSCHGEKGAGDGPDSTVLTSALPHFSDGSFDKSLGITAANITYGKNDEMPAFKEKLSEEKIWSVAKYLLSLDK